MSKISIIVPCYNQGDFLDRALNSVYNQSFSDWECIIVNDGSTDSTLEVIEIWCKNDFRFKSITKENGGLSSARNAGMAIAKGEFIQFLDADDVLAQGKLIESLKALNKKEFLEDKGVALTNFRMFRKSSNDSSQPYCLLSEDFFNFYSVLMKWSVTSIPIHCGLINKNLLKNFKFPEDLRAVEDWIMWIHIFKNEPNVVFVDQPLAFYRRHSNSLTADSGAMEENLRKAIPYVLQYVKPEDYIFKSFFEIQKYNLEIVHLKTKLSHYETTRTYRYSERFKNTILGKFMLYLFKIRKA